MSLSRLWEIVEEQGILASCSPWGYTELDMTEWLNLNIGNKISVNLGLAALSGVKMAAAFLVRVQ